MWPLVEYLKQSSLVADIQKKFGVAEVEKKERNNKKYEDGDKINQGKNEKPTNGYVAGESVENYIIGNRFWYYLFSLGTALGDEIFYASFIPFWFWNIDGAVGRRVVLIWAVIMYIGQGLKDIIRWPRPTFPAKKLQTKWAEEYGMPSTHAMVAVAMPFSVLFYTRDRYIYSIPLGLAICIVWCCVICMSRIYFGMHTVLDIIVGFWLAVLLMVVLLPLIDSLDNMWVTNYWSPVILFTTSFLLIHYFPHTEKWTPTRGDTTVIIGVMTGIHIGAWINYQLGNMTPYPLPPPYRIIWPDLYMLGLGGLRTTIGFTLVYTCRFLSKKLSAVFLHSILQTKMVDIRKVADPDIRKKLVFIELASKYFTYFLVGFNTSYLMPLFFRCLGIERPTFYTEI